MDYLFAFPVNYLLVTCFSSKLFIGYHDGLVQTNRNLRLKTYKILFLISQPKHALWVLKGIVSKR